MTPAVVLEADSTASAVPTSQEKHIDLANVQPEAQNDRALFDPLSMDIFAALDRLIEQDVPALVEEQPAAPNNYPMLLSLVEKLRVQARRLAGASDGAEDTDMTMDHDHDDNTVTDTQDAQLLLDTLSKLLLLPPTTRMVRRNFRPLLVDLVARWLEQTTKAGAESMSEVAIMELDAGSAGLDVLLPSEMALIAFATLLPTAPQVRSLALAYFGAVASPLQRLEHMLAMHDDPKFGSLSATW
ncbi:hypothetical protein THASP1DRAFT_25946 [Thamnocephalis sphaerospora]|uniref:Uncharacterized protein n=1 Tax=Thamnocephalis sphaerospora TaxID=78915 RepID=A0A4P9XIN1_9FUNG|nr:hypothetical protein THASP1DRAFT_25946 [Thamnocephalis sphaerospora]|eukprot:RKP05573.1 hypothetical protein THASP1DRAFT_25946 [Thamnocephalis sphaerospora]